MRLVARRPLGWWSVMIAIVAITAGCVPSPGILLTGLGPGPTGPMMIAEGTYHIHWTAQDHGITDHGCLLGLSVEWVADPVGPANRRDTGPTKFVYRTLERGDSIVGDYPGLHLPAGTYRLRSEGSCAWQAEITRAAPRETPTVPRMINDGSLEQG